jgi:hypothetical protein
MDSRDAARGSMWPDDWREELDLFGIRTGIGRQRLSPLPRTWRRNQACSSVFVLRDWCRETTGHCRGMGADGEVDFPMAACANVATELGV